VSVSPTNNRSTIESANNLVQATTNVLAPISPEETAIEIDNITVAYRSYQERPSTLKESVICAIKNRKLKHYSTFNALSNVSFKVKKGTVFGILGSNGAGKSTLLKVLSGVLPPSTGSIKINGVVDSLIQLGAGFDADLNAIENIYLYGSLHRKSREDIKKRIPAILEFAELEEFKTTPVKYYSSGMYARLGFSVAIDRDPDILLVDEVLAVGDERFRNKCNNVFKEFIARGKTIIMVSHSLAMFTEHADQVGLLSKGKLIYIGTPEEAIKMYRDTEYVTALK
jgi:ABC-type polysaccharide/polyol phosphate transport system ATPase subunit